MLQACATRPPHRLVVKSSTRAWRSLTWVKASAKPERVATSSMTSGRSIFGMRAEMAACSATRLGGRSSLSSGLSTSSSRSLRRSIRGAAAGLLGKFAATWRQARSRRAAKSPISVLASSERSKERQTVRRAAFQPRDCGGPTGRSAWGMPAGTEGRDR